MTYSSRVLAAALLCSLALVLVGVDITLAGTEYTVRRPIHVASVISVPILAVGLAAAWVRHSLLERLDRLEVRLFRRMDSVRNGQVEHDARLEGVSGEIPVIPIRLATLMGEFIREAVADGRVPAVGRAPVLTAMPQHLAAEGPTVPLPRRSRRRRRPTDTAPGRPEAMEKWMGDAAEAYELGRQAGRAERDQGPPVE